MPVMIVTGVWDLEEETDNMPFHEYSPTAELTNKP